MGITVLSLCDGISGGQIALERIGISVDTYYASEIDKYAIQITQKNYPNTVQLGDIFKVDGKKLPKIDLLIGGVPCQAFSFAGKQLNFADPRSKLFFEYIRIRSEVNPKWFLLENVNMKKEYKDVLTSYMKVEPLRINSHDFSAQDRDRLYWTNIPFDSNYIPNTETVEDILEDEVDSKYIIEPRRAVLVLEDEVKRRKIAVIGSDAQANRIYSIHGKSVTLLGDAGGLGAKMGIYALPCTNPGYIVKRQNGRRFKPPKSKFFALTAQDRHGILTNHFIRKLTPTECERLQRAPHGYTEGIPDNQRYRCLGNGWTVSVIEHILKGLNWH